MSTRSWNENAMRPTTFLASSAWESVSVNRKYGLGAHPLTARGVRLLYLSPKYGGLVT